ncbi:hypothetical protein SAMN05216338_10793 [Bradyrhizobium sp. Rc2d]|uniref:hypothetical protein n=1 Tax=Bradyrhizobium sp. Rc2d TaxID=1855321 RepID=UPI00087EFC45|nr:hypothetical protein [Bradyrhizobium sp. Rc2d]SDJ99851.1 hypothetical protein SAMN05216338_10793 [Bradyrhizobium sp. Rc2d]
MDRPYRYQGSDPLHVSAEAVFDAVKAIVSSGQEQAFIAKCNEVGAFVSVEPQFINLVKDFIFENKSISSIETARELLRSARCSRGLASN